jgi:hypothetical protein
MAETPTHWHGLKKAETGITPEQVAEQIAQEIGRPFTVKDLERFMAEKMGVEFVAKYDVATNEVVHVPVPPPGMENFFCAAPAPSPASHPEREYMTEEKALEISRELAIAFMRHAGDLKAPRGAVLDSLVGMIARTLESYDEPELRAEMVTKTQEALAYEFASLKAIQN